MNRNYLLTILTVFILIGAFVGFYLTGRVTEGGVSVWIESTDMETNNTYQNLSCYISGSGDTFFSNWQKNGEDYYSSFSRGYSKDFFDLYHQELGITGVYFGDVVSTSISAREDSVYVGGYTTDKNNVVHRFVVKYDLDGNIVWWSVGDSSESTYISEIDVDENGNLYYIATDYSSKAYFGRYDSNGNFQWEFLSPLQYPILITAANDGVYFVASPDKNVLLKYDLSGNQLWNQTTLGTSIFDLGVYGGDIITTGYYYDFVSHYLYTEKMDSSGGQIWNLTYYSEIEGYSPPVISRAEIEIDENGRSHIVFLREEFQVSQPLGYGEYLADETRSFFQVLVLNQNGEIEHVGYSPAIPDFPNNFDIDLINNFYYFDYAYNGTSDSTDFFVNKYNYESGVFERSFFDNIGGYQTFNNFDIYREKLYFVGEFNYSNIDYEEMFRQYSLYSVKENPSFEEKMPNDILYDKTQIGDDWSCYGFILSGQTFSNIVSSEVMKITNRIYNLNITSPLNFYNGTWHPLKVRVDCLYEDCGSVEVFLNKGEKIFYKPDYAVYTYPECKNIGTCDCVSEDVCIARGDALPLFNAISQIPEDGKSNCSANVLGTEWSPYACDDSIQEDFMELFLAMALVEGFEGGCYPEGALSGPMCLHVLSTDEYIDIQFLNWTPSNAGGGFAYSRVSSVSTSPVGEIWTNESSKKIVDVGSGFGEIVFWLFSFEESAIDVFLNSRIIGVENSGFNIGPILLNSTLFVEENQVVEVPAEEPARSSSGGYVPVRVEGDFVINKNILETSLFHSQEGYLDLEIFNNRTLSFNLPVNIYNLSEFVDSESYIFILERGNNLIRTRISIPENISKGKYEGVLNLGSPLNKEIPIKIDVLERTTQEEVDEPIVLDIKKEEIIFETSSTGEGRSVVPVVVKMDYITPEKYLNEIVEIDYSVLDNYETVKYYSEKDFLVSEDFNGDVELNVPSDLDSGNYTIETETKTPDNFLITGKYALVIEEEGEAELPFWPTFFVFALILVIGIIMWLLLGRDKED